LVDIIADVPGRDHRHAASYLPHDEAAQLFALLQTEELHLARLADREQRINIMRQVPVNKALEPRIIDDTVFGERGNHHGNYAVDALAHSNIPCCSIASISA